jgi:hypothetical protein
MLWASRRSSAPRKIVVLLSRLRMRSDAALSLPKATSILAAKRWAWPVSGEPGVCLKSISSQARAASLSSRPVSALAMPK